MISTLVIVFRETLEAALIVSIVLAASRGIAGRTAWVAAGILGGLVGAGLVAILADVIAGLAEGVGTELFNAAVLLVAVVMLGWHQIWMSRHGAELAIQSRALGNAVATGRRPLSALAVVTGVAILREGSETVLFLYGIAAEGTSDTRSMLLGAALGVAGAATLGWVIYAGLMRIPLRHIFRVTGAIVTLLAAGLAAQAAAFLVQAGVLPALGFRIWDTSWLLSEENPLGQLLHILVGYVAKPEGIQIVAYLATLAAIVLASFAVHRTAAPRPQSRPA